MGDQIWQWLVVAGKGVCSAVLFVLAAMHPHAAAGAAFGCCFFLAYPSASRGLRRLLYGVFSWGIGYATGVFFYGGGPPYSQKAMLVSAAAAALAVLIFIAWGGIIRRDGNLPPWAQSILDIVFPFRAKRGEKDGN
ncbi:hypothetical protein D3C85_1307190 [compost metagenome]